MAERSWSLLVTSEHGGNDVPAEYRSLFRARAKLLASHRGWDPGTLDLAERLADTLDAALVSSTVTRLLVDLNRSPQNPRVFSEITRALPRGERMSLLEQFHRPHWDTVRALLARSLRDGARILHLGVHSFTPVLSGIRRKPDIGLLYDPARRVERKLVAAWRRSLADAVPARIIRRNDPYRGYTDGLATAMRRELTQTSYVGVEIEVNQRHVGRDGRFPVWVADALVESLSEVLA